MSESHTKHSQRDDPGGEALGDSLGVHTEGAVFGAGAGRRTAGYLRGSPGIQLPRQAKTQSPQTDQPRPSLSEFQHPWAGGRGRNPPLKVSACSEATVSLLTSPAVLIKEREDGGGRPPQWVWVLCPPRLSQELHAAGMTSSAASLH